MFVLLLTPAPAAVLVMTRLRKGGRQEVGIIGRIGTESLEKGNGRQEVEREYQETGRIGRGRQEIRRKGRGRQEKWE